jgi:hypothetical protein
MQGQTRISLSTRGITDVTSIYNMVGWIDLGIGGLATLLSLFSANWVGLALGIAVMVHSAAWEQLDKLSDEFEELKNQRRTP